MAPKESPVLEILLAEDNQADVVLVRETLKEHSLNCGVHVMPDGEQAIAFLNALDLDPQEPRLDLLLVDMHLPRCDGAQVLATLRQTVHYAATPVIVMTASDSPADRDRMRDLAALHYFRKPSSLAEFMQLGAMVKSILTGGAPLENQR